MRQDIIIGSIGIDGRTKVPGIALVVIIARDGDIQRLVDVTVDYHRNGDISRKRGPPGKVRRTDAKRSQLHGISHRRSGLIGVQSLCRDLDIVASGSQPLSDILLDGNTGRNLHLLDYCKVCKLGILHHDGT